MNTSQLILSNNFLDLYASPTICTFCKSNNLSVLTSKSKSKYTYCMDCNSDKELAFKHYFLDEILYYLKSELKSFDKKLLFSIKIDLHNYNGFIDLFINNIKVNQFKFEYSLSKKECYHLKVTILYLIHDYTDTSNIEINCINF